MAVDPLVNVGVLVVFVPVGMGSGASVLAAGGL